MKLRSLVALALLAACGHGSGGSGAAAHDFRHCLTATPPTDRHVTVAGLTLDVAGGAVRITSRTDIRLGLTTRVAESETIAPDFDALAVLGGLGGDAAAVAASVRALAATDRVVLVVLGGDDDAALVRDALAGLEARARERVVDVSAARTVDIGAQQFVPVPGAPNGRYALSARHCGFDAADLEARAALLGATPPRVRRHLLAWAMPAGLDVAEGIDGVDAGDLDLARFAHGIGATGGLFAWPQEGAGRIAGGATDLRAVARPLSGSTFERADGVRVPSGPPSIVVVAGDGLHAQP